MISAPFSLTHLHSSRPCATVDGSNAYIGISQSCVSLQSLKPPQELDAWSVSPGTEITAVALGDVVFYATKERKKTSLKRVDGVQIAVPHAVHHLYAVDSLVFCIYENYQIDAYDTDLKLQYSTEPTSDKVVFSEMIDEQNCCVVSQLGSKYKLNVVSLQASSCVQETTELKWAVGSGSWTLCGSALYLGRGSSIYQTDVYSGAELEIDVKADVHDLIAVSPSKVCTVLDDLSFVTIDTEFQAQVAELQLESLVSLISYSQEAQVILAASDSMLLGFPFEPTSGSLLDSIGKGIKGTPRYEFGFSDILNVHASVKDTRKIALARVEEATQENRRIVLEFKKFFEAGSADCVGIAGWFKGGEWSDPGLVVYEETDRQVDKDIMVAVATLAFSLDKKPTYASFLPTSFGLYLLTHPLFPVCNVFPALKDPQMYHQAIVSLKGISASALIIALSNPLDDIFSDAVKRLEEFSHDQIKEGFAEVAKDLKSSGLSKLLTRLGNHPDSAFLISPLVDIVGLHSWDRSVLEALDTRLARQVEYLRAAELTKTALSELLKQVDIDLNADSSLSRSELKRKSRKGVENEQRRGASVELPSYGVEELVFT